MGLTPGLGRSPGEGNGNPLQYSCLENPMDRGAWWATVHTGRKESDMTEQLISTLHGDRRVLLKPPQKLQSPNLGQRREDRKS